MSTSDTKAISRRSFMIYGANGYTGTLIAEEATRRGLHPILAGRNAAKIRKLGARLQMESRVFDCQDPLKIRAEIEDMELVLHCAGPFSQTSQPMFEACLQAKTHYLDISGEIQVFERILSQSARFKRAGITAVPGVGFDVVPTDCLAALLKRELPDAERISLAIRGEGPVSPGTFKTMIESLRSGCLVRSEGTLKTVPLFSKSEIFSFPGSRRKAHLVPLADVSSAYYSTGIPNIECYSVSGPSSALISRLVRIFRPALASGFIQTILKTMTTRTIQGPGESMRGQTPYEVAGRVTNPSGQVVEMALSVPNGYALTVESALLAVQKIIEGKCQTGALTPAQTFSPEFVFELNSVRRFTV